MMRRAREIVCDWQPDVVQAEFHVMGQYLAGLPTRPARILVDTSPVLPLRESEPP